MRLPLSMVLLWGCEPEGAPTSEVAARGGGCDRDFARVAMVNAGLAAVAEAEAQVHAVHVAGAAVRPFAVRAASESRGSQGNWEISQAAAGAVATLESAAAEASALSEAPLAFPKPGGQVDVLLSANYHGFYSGVWGRSNALMMLEDLDQVPYDRDALINARAEFAASYRSIRRSTRCAVALPACPECDAAPPAIPDDAASAAAVEANAAEGREIVARLRLALNDVRSVLARMRGVAASQQTYRFETFAEDAWAVDSIAEGTMFNGLRLTQGRDSVIGIHLSQHVVSPVPLHLADLRATVLGVDSISLATRRQPEALAALDGAIAVVDRGLAVAAEDLPRMAAPQPPPPESTEIRPFSH